MVTIFTFNGIRNYFRKKCDHMHMYECQVDATIKYVQYIKGLESPHSERSRSMDLDKGDRSRSKSVETQKRFAIASSV